MTWTGPLSVALPVALAMLVLATALALVRLVAGPSSPDRVVAVDLVSALSVGIIAVHTVVTGEEQLLQAATVVALLAFLSTVAFAGYVMRRGR
jgi:multicomponent Na+:H+ antiporter subunit F